MHVTLFYATHVLTCIPAIPRTEIARIVLELMGDQVSGQGRPKQVASGEGKTPSRMPLSRASCHRRVQHM